MAQLKRLPIKKEKFWEYKLTSTLLVEWIDPIERTWNDLRLDLYSKRRVIRKDRDFLEWFSSKLDLASSQAKALAKLVNDELGHSWGAPGEPGSVEEIVRTCAYMTDACKRVLEWEEDMYFSHASGEYGEIIRFSRGAIGHNISEIMKIPKFVDNILSGNPNGTYKLDVVISMRDGWETECEEAFDQLRLRLGIG